MEHFGAKDGADDDALLVAEDDARFSAQFGAVIRGVLERSDFGWVLLANPFEEGGSSPFWSKNRDRVALSWLAWPVGPGARPYSYRVGRYEGELWGTGLYMVTRKAARRLAEYAARQGQLSWRADDYSLWHLPAGIDVHMLRPGVAGFAGESEIHPTERGHVNQAEYSASLLGRQAWKRRAHRVGLALTATRRSIKRSSHPR